MTEGEETIRLNRIIQLDLDLCRVWFSRSCVTKFSRAHLRYCHLCDHRRNTLLQDLSVSINLNSMIMTSFKKILQCTVKSSISWEQSLAFGSTYNLMQETDNLYSRRQKIKEDGEMRRSKICGSGI